MSDLAFATDLAGARSFEDLTGRLYAGICGAFGPLCAGLDLLDPDSRQARQTSAMGVSDYFMARYDRLARHVDPVLNFAIENRVVAHNLSLMSQSQWRSSQIYEDVFALHRMTSLVYAPIVVDGRVVGTLNLGRDEDAGEFSTRQLDRVASLAGLLGVVLGSIQLTEALERRAAELTGAIDLCDEPIVVSHLWAGVRYVNPAAAAILARRPLGAPELDEELATHRVQAARSRGSGPAAGLIDHSESIGGSGGLVTFLRPDTVDRVPEWLRTKLTARERDVVLLAVQGLRDSEIADELMLSPHTVKSYLRDVYRKLEIRSRVELARLASVKETPLVR